MFLQINNFFIIYTSWIFVVLLSFYVLFDESFQLLKKWKKNRYALGNELYASQ